MTRARKIKRVAGWHARSPAYVYSGMCSPVLLLVHAAYHVLHFRLQRAEVLALLLRV